MFDANLSPAMASPTVGLIGEGRGDGWESRRTKEETGMAYVSLAVEMNGKGIGFP